MIKTFVNEEAVKASRFVKLDGAAVKVAAGSSENIIGVSLDVDAPANYIVDVALQGEITEVEAGEAFFAGCALTADSEGKAVEAKYGDNVAAIALQNATAQGDIVEVQVALMRAFAAPEETSSETP